jgi:hypothetical protein
MSMKHIFCLRKEQKISLLKTKHERYTYTIAIVSNMQYYISYD